MSRTMPTECEHGEIIDWGDFGPCQGDCDHEGDCPNFPDCPDCMETRMTPEQTTAINANDGEAVSAWLRRPDNWEAIAAAIGPHPYTYYLEDSSHRLDLVQIVCEAAAFHARGKGL